MTITYRVDPETRLILTTGQGVVTDSELQEYMRTILTHPDVRPGLNELVDLRTVTEMPVSERAIGTTIQAVLEVGRQIKETKTALVASDGNAEEISRFYELLRTSVPSTVRLFRDLSSARAWLGLADDDPQTARPQRVAPRNQVRFSSAAGRESDKGRRGSSTSP